MQECVINNRDRLLFRIAGKQEPYCIVRVIDVALDAVHVYFSLFKRDHTLRKNKTFVFDLSRREIKITLSGANGSSATLHIETDAKIEVRPLNPMPNKERY
jgi:hypothetical protein